MSQPRPTPEAAVLASRIRTIDRNLDALEAATDDSVIRGLHSSGAATTANLGQTAAKQKHADLIAERANLVQQLKALVDSGSAYDSRTSVS